MAGTGGSRSFRWSPDMGRRAYAFVDGTNLIAELRNSRLTLPSIFRLVSGSVSQMLVLRVYVYTTEEKADKAKTDFGAEFFAGCRLVYGDSVPTPKGEPREKGVDAQLVADLVYHAASRNADHMILVANDSDFRFAIKRVEDFGCTSEILWVIKEPNQRLRESADGATTRDREFLIKYLHGSDFNGVA
jgi:NYN domain